MTLLRAWCNDGNGGPRFFCATGWRRATRSMAAVFGGDSGAQLERVAVRLTRVS